MLEECLELRRQEAIDTILSRPLPEVVRHHLHSCFDEGWLPEPDVHGRPVYILRGGKTGERLNKLAALAGDAWTALLPNDIRQLRGQLLREGLEGGKMG